MLDIQLLFHALYTDLCLVVLHICKNVFVSSDYDELSAINVKENNHLVSEYLISTEKCCNQRNVA